MLNPATPLPTTLISSTLSSTPSASDAADTPSASAASLQQNQDSDGGIEKTANRSNTMTTTIAIAAPVGGVVVLGILFVIFKKNRGCFRHKKEQNGSILIDDEEISSWRNVQHHDKFDPARNY